MASASVAVSAAACRGGCGAPAIFSPERHGKRLGEMGKALLVFLQTGTLADFPTQQDLVGDQIEGGLGVGPQFGLLRQVVFRGPSFTALPARTLVGQQRR